MIALYLVANSSYTFSVSFLSREEVSTFEDNVGDNLSLPDKNLSHLQNTKTYTIGVVLSTTKGTVNETFFYHCFYS